MIRKANSKGKIVKAPGVVHKYNETMGGVDLGDQLMAQYEPQFRSTKFWKKIFFSLWWPQVMILHTGIRVNLKVEYSNIVSYWTNNIYFHFERFIWFHSSI